MLTRFWNFLNGNKTLICAALLYAMTLGIVKDNIHPDILKMAEYILLALGGASLTHRVAKGVKAKKEA